jgi:3-oxoacyl-[acyl-carrier-protein] synthase-1
LEKAVYVAGTGVVSAIGKNLSETLTSFRSQVSGIGKISLFETIYVDTLPAGEVKLSNSELATQVSARPDISRTAPLGIVAAREAVMNSCVDTASWRTGLISATTVGGMDKTENFFLDFLRDNKMGRLRDVVNHACGRSTECIADDLGVRDFMTTINTACSSSVNAILLGAKMIKHNLLDVVVAGGTDALSKFTLNGFNSLMILDNKPCRPFCASRNGLNLGEGAGYVVLVSDRVRAELQLETQVRVAGYANTNDAFHQTASSPDGRGSFAAMNKALVMSGLAPSDIQYINLHGTGTQNNDASEGIAVRRLFGETYPRLSSTKAFTGHTLGASGGIEAVFSILAIQHQCALPNLRFETPIPECEIVPQLQFEEDITIKNVMSNSFGFGGNCSSIVFSAA